MGVDFHMATQMDIFKSLFSMIIIFALCLSFAQNAEGSASTDYDLFEYGIFKVGLRKGFNNAKSAMFEPKRIFYHLKIGFFLNF